MPGHWLLKKFHNNSKKERCAVRLWVPCAFFSRPEWLHHMITRIWMTLMLRAATFSTTCPVLSSIINSNAPALDQTIQTLQSPSMLTTIRLCWGGCQAFKKENPRLWRRKPLSRLYEPSAQTSKNKFILIKWKINFSLELFLGPWQKTGLQLFQGASFAKY